MENVTERYATINGLAVNFEHGPGVWSVVCIRSGTEVGYKTSRRAAEKFAFGIDGDRSGKTWEKYSLQQGG